MESLRNQMATFLIDNLLPNEAPRDWQEWLRELFPTYITHPFGDRHKALWEWVWAINPTERSRPFVAIWPRGGGKSTSAELAVVALAARNIRRYAIYVRRTQDQADNSITNIAGMLESKAVANYYPRLSQRKIGKYGNPAGWRRNRLTTNSQFTVDAMGLDTASRGAKVDENRPDLLIFDDIDKQDDSSLTIEKNINTITKAILPTGTSRTTTLAIQNLIIPNGVFAQLANGDAKFLADRIVSGPYPAIIDLDYEQVDDKYFITGGTPTWAGQDLEAAQGQIWEWGLDAFRVEAQHEVDLLDGGIYSEHQFKRCDRSEVPDLEQITVWVDPAVTDNDGSDARGIHADGISNGVVYRLYSWEGKKGSPEDILRRATLKAIELGADTLGVETDQGGDLWEIVYNSIWDKMEDDGTVSPSTLKPEFESARAGAIGSKVHRGQLQLTEYQKGRFIHVRGTHLVLEKALRRFPKFKPFDLHDAAFWAGWYLIGNDVDTGTVEIRI